MPRTPKTLLLASALAIVSSASALGTAEDPFEAILRGADEVRRLGDPAEGDPIMWRAQWRDASTCGAVTESHDAQFAQGRPGMCSAPTAFFRAIGEHPEGDMPTSAAYSLDGSTLILANRDSANLVLFDAHSREYLRSIEISGGPQAIALHPDGVRIVTANIDTESMSLVNLDTGLEELVVPVGTMPGAIGITSDGSKAIVGNTGDATISIIDLDTGKVLHVVENTSFTMTFTVAPEPGAVSLAFSSFIVIGNETIIHPSSSDDAIFFIDIDTGSVNSLAVGDWPRGIDLSADGTIAIVSQYNQSFVTVVDVVTQSIRGTISIGENCNGPVALSSDGTRAAVAVLNAVRIVDLEDETVSGQLSTATVYDLITTSNGAYALGIGYRGSLIDFEAASIVVNANNQMSTPVGAVSPTDPFAAMAANVFGEDLVFCSTDGASGGHLETRPSGPDPEGDICRSVAVNGASGMVASVGLFSRNVEIRSAESGELLGRYATGARPSELAFTPDGSKLVVANLDSYHATIIDLESWTSFDAAISWRGSRVVISPDSRHAYIPVVASGDGIWRIDLDTGLESGGKLATGNMGSVGYSYSRTSGIALSHDGATLVTCDSFSDTITVIDTASWSVVATVAMGGFPTFAAFSEDDATLFVSLRNYYSVARVHMDGADSTLLDTISVGGQPKHLIPTLDGSMLYVLRESDQAITVVDLMAGSVDRDALLSISPRGFALSPSGECLYVGAGTQTVSAGGNGFSRTQEGSILVLDSVTLDVLDTFDTGLTAAQFVLDSEHGVGAIASPGGDGILVIGGIPPCLGDLDGNGLVNGADLTMLLATWGPCTGCSEDLNGDDLVNGADLTILLASWGDCS